MAKMAFQHQAGTAMECLSVSFSFKKWIITTTNSKIQINQIGNDVVVVTH